MAFNSAFETRRKRPIQQTSDDHASSFFSDSQTSWVVFGPDDHVANDILLLSTENQLTETESDGNSEQDLDETQSLARSKVSEADDDLIDDLHYNLSSRINEWQKTTDTDATAALVSDNVALWDLDAEFMSQVLDTSILRRVPAYYGDQYFQNMTKAEYLRFRKTSLILRKSLTRKGFDTRDPQLISRLLNLLKWRDLLQSPGSLVEDYIVNTLSRVHLQTRVFKDAEFSDSATSSSLVLCGGGSWNDI